MNVYCSICGKQYDMRDPNIRRIWGEDTWECADESACFERKAMAALDIQAAALTAVLEARGQVEDFTPGDTDAD